MTHRFLTRISMGALSCLLLLSLGATPKEEPTKNAGAEWTPITPGPADGAVAYVTARLLESQHYIKQQFDATVSGKLLDRYLKSLDPQRMHFLQSDIDEFEKYR